MTQDVSKFTNADLVLRVSSSIDPKKFDVTQFEYFLVSLCRDLQFQKEAIRTTANYLFGGRYRDTASLAEENFRNNEKLREKYPDFKRMERELPFPKKLACSLDLATGTGKSFVMYGLARIALATGYVDRVLILCPSTTIEAGLREKFLALSRDRGLLDSLPKGARVRNPHVVGGHETVVAGDICIENIHATYSGNKSAIAASFRGKGGSTLVLCDEAHHIYSAEGDRELRKWKEFLQANEFGFRYVVGLSGTCYSGDEYFPDVVARYSLSQAIEDGVVKTIKYVDEDASANQDERFQKIYSNHRSAKLKYRKVKPLTVIVARDIASCKALEDELVTFLAGFESIPRADAAAKVLRVHTPRTGAGAREDVRIADNIDRLKAGEPDSSTSPIEWIVSVSMLTEGWDAKNVFQIVPHEEKAFNSKLLVAQVLGRGLRIPEAYKREQPVVTVFNHASWSGKIKHLVDEVLEWERRIYSEPIQKKPSFDFSVHQIRYEKAEDVVETRQISEYVFDMPFVRLASQRKSLDRETTYVQVLTGEKEVRKSRIALQMFPVEEVVGKVHNKFRAIDLETGSNYATKYTRVWLRKLIRKSLGRIGYKGDEVSGENVQRILSSFGNLKRQGSKSIRYRIAASHVHSLRVSERPRTHLNYSSLRRGAAVFYDACALEADGELRDSLKELEQDIYYRGALNKVPNSFDFKTCLVVGLTVGEPEWKFVRRLVEPENAKHVSAWIKNSDVGFYSIDYSYSRGEYSDRGSFNPDFFIALDSSSILVVEIKGDDELRTPSPETQGKRRSAVEHFDLLNSLQKRVKYHVCFLTPENYDLFFAELRDGRGMRVQSQLDVALGGNESDSPLYLSARAPKRRSSKRR